MPEHTGVHVVSRSLNTTSAEGSGGETNPEYIAFVLVPVFFLLGLLGVFICHVLKRKGYRCTTQEPGAEDGTPGCQDDDEDPELGDLNDTLSDNNDTVGQIVHMIMKNEANSDALKAMVTQDSIDSDAPPLTPVSPTPSTPPLTPVSPGPPWAPAGAAASSRHTCSHLHTVGGPGGLRNTCSRCSQKKWPLMRRPSPRKAESRRSHQEVTVLAVGRFRVTKCEKPPRERRTLLISEANGSAGSSTTEAEPNSRTTSESQPEPTK